ncbi:hypothetical protein RLOatenuis_3950 [Rickettsiales bacterium]|nr:hypothetical protein RLOatenuis_3950 [Rickettsiales bacterium]
MKNQEKLNKEMKNPPSSELQEPSSYELGPEALKDLEEASEDCPNWRSKKDPESKFEKEYKYYKAYKESVEGLKMHNDILLFFGERRIKTIKSPEALEGAIQDAINNAEANNIKILFECKNPSGTLTWEAAKKKDAKGNIFSKYENSIRIFTNDVGYIKEIKLNGVLEDCKKDEDPKRQFLCQLLIREILQNLESKDEYKTLQKLMNLKEQYNSENGAPVHLEREIVLSGPSQALYAGSLSNEHKGMSCKGLKEKYITLIDDDLAESLDAKYQEEKSKEAQGAEKVFDIDKEKDGFVIV